jgi:cell division protein FtsW
MLLLLSAAALFSLGLVMIFSTTSAEILDFELEMNTHQAVMKQFSFAFGGLLLALLVLKTGYRRLLECTPWLLLLFTFLLLLALLPGIGREVNGSRRWLNLFGFSFQPSEFVKYLAPAWFIYRFLQLEGRFTFREFLKTLALLAVPLLLILVEPNNGTAAVILSVLAALFLLARVPLSWWALPLLAFICIGGVFAWQLPYVAGRLKIYLHPELDLRGRGHQPYQAKIAAGSGQLWGKGPGNSLQKLSYLPESQNDYIAAIYAEEFGFAGMGVLILLYMLLAAAGFYIAYTAEDIRGFYLAACSTFLIAFQAFLNLGVVSSLLPSTGLNLPLFSQGGSSLMANMAGMALLFSISKRKP